MGSPRPPFSSEYSLEKEGAGVAPCTLRNVISSICFQLHSPSLLQGERGGGREHCSLPPLLPLHQHHLVEEGRSPVGDSLIPPLGSRPCPHGEQAPAQEQALPPWGAGPCSAGGCVVARGHRRPCGGGEKPRGRIQGMPLESPPWGAGGEVVARGTRPTKAIGDSARQWARAHLRNAFSRISFVTPPDNGLTPLRRLPLRTR